MMSSNVLWRLDHLPKLKKAPKAAVVLIGTNNICWGSDTPREGAEGVQAVAKKLHELYPETKILALAVLPRREKPDHPHRREIVELNSHLPDLLKGIGNARPPRDAHQRKASAHSLSNSRNRRAISEERRNSLHSFTPSW